MMIIEAQNSGRIAGTIVAFGEDCLPFGWLLNRQRRSMRRQLLMKAIDGAEHPPFLPASSPR